MTDAEEPDAARDLPDAEEPDAARDLPDVDRRLDVREGAVLSGGDESATVVLDIDGGGFLALNATGAVLWARLRRGASTAELVEHLAGTFDIEHEVALRDTREFVGRCMDLGLLVVA